MSAARKVWDLLRGEYGWECFRCGARANWLPTLDAAQHELAEHRRQHEAADAAQGIQLIAARP